MFMSIDFHRTLYVLKHAIRACVRLFDRSYVAPENLFIHHTTADCLQSAGSEQGLCEPSEFHLGG